MRGLTCTRRLYKDTLLFTAHSSGKCVFKGFFPPEDTKHHLLPPVAASNTHTDTQMCCRCITHHINRTVCTHMRQTHKDNFLKYSQRHLGFECGQKDGTQLCVLCVCGGGVMGLLFCNLLLDPRGSWIATPDYLGAGASTRKVIPWRQIESLSRLSLFSLNFFILSHSPFIFFLNLSPSDT